MTTANKITTLVTGATGQQGGAVARALAEQGHQVRAFTRRPDSPAAKQLKRRGAEVVQGNFDDAASLERAMQGVDAVFAMATPMEVGAAAETRHGRNLIDAARKASVKHLVYSSVASAEHNTGIPHFDSKYAVETHLRSTGLPWTIVAPVFFMENLLGPMMLPSVRRGELRLALPARRVLQQVALADLAKLVSLVIERRGAFLGKRIEVASDGITGEQAATFLSRSTGHEVKYVEQPIAELDKANRDFATMFRWFDRVGYSIDIPALHRRYPEVSWHTFEDWAKKQDWRKLEAAAE